jgi:hypothetical protein
MRSVPSLSPLFSAFTVPLRYCGVCQRANPAGIARTEGNRASEAEAALRISRHCRSDLATKARGDMLKNQTPISRRRGASFCVGESKIFPEQLFRI